MGEFEKAEACLQRALDQEESAVETDDRLTYYRRGV